MIRRQILLSIVIIRLLFTKIGRHDGGGKIKENKIKTVLLLLLDLFASNPIEDQKVSIYFLVYTPAALLYSILVSEGAFQVSSNIRIKWLEKLNLDRTEDGMYL